MKSNSEKALSNPEFPWDMITSEELQKFIDNGADVNVRGRYRQTPLIMAVAHGNFPDIVRTLIDNGADVHARDKYNCTALLRAVGNTCTIEFEMVKMLIDAGSNVNAQDADKLSPLMLATINKNLSVMRLLIDAGADPNATSKQGLTPLDWAKELDGKDNLSLICILTSQRYKIVKQ